MRGLIRLLLVAGVIAGLWWLLRELLEEPSPGADAGANGRPDEAPTRTADPSASSNGAGSPSKAELYRQAQELDVAGRSKMNKEQLAEAVTAARRA